MYGSTVATATTASTLISNRRLGRLFRGLAAVRITNTTRVCVARDSTNHPLWKSDSFVDAWNAQSSTTKVRKSITDHARESNQQQQKRALEQTRAAIVSKRSKEAIRGRLESILTALSEEQARLRVQECLARDDLGEMKALIHEMRGQVGQRSPEEKLTDLLDSLKPYCSDEELDRFCAQAFHILATASFKDSRSFVVSTHDQLRTRLKELEEQNAIESE